jgi:mono/diheme cytochrome c family protein
MGMVAALYETVAILKVASARLKGWEFKFVQTYSPGRRRKKKASQTKSARAASRGPALDHCWICHKADGLGISGFFG